MFPDDIMATARAVIAAARAKGIMIVTAESCTGGLVAGALTAVAGSSAVVDRGFVTYSNAAKEQLLGVPSDLIEIHGAVSEAVARAMAEGALAQSGTALAVSVTGVAGPGGGTDAKPVGLVHFGLARMGAATEHRAERFGDIGRDAVRAASVRVALELLAGGVEAAE